VSVHEPPVAVDRGLDQEAVRERVRLGQINDVPDAPTRTVAQIVAHNVFNRFTALLGGLFVLIVIFGDLRDGLFGFVLLANSAIGIVQELRAKRALDRLAVVVAPQAAAVREGQLVRIPSHEVVLDDVVQIGAGDQVVVDGDVVASDGLEINEALLTGESDTVVKQPGDPVLSGSFVAAGSGRYRATKVGAHAYAAELATQAREFKLARSEVRSGIDRILRLVTWALVPSGALLVLSQMRAHSGLSHAIAASVAGVVAMIP
jgi:cation-transporting P-type ATPase E